MAGFRQRFRSAWNAFSSVAADPADYQPAGGVVASYGSRPDRPRSLFMNDRSIISSIYTRIGIDVSDIRLRHVKLDENGRYMGDMKSYLNDCLTVEPNIDQGPRAFRQDIAMTLFEQGVAAIVPVDTTEDPFLSDGFDVQSVRVGEITNWYPSAVKVSVYNERVGRREEVVLPKKSVAIVVNPLYSVMNEPNSTLQRLIRKLSLMDSVDEMTSSGKLDLIIQLPYVVKSEARRQQAEQRRHDIEDQLKGSQYGIAYTDGTERITQLNRPVENNLLKQVEYLTDSLYAQLGLTQDVMNGTADEKAMLNYYNRTVNPIVDAITEAMRRTFLSKTARTRGQSIMYFRDMFSLTPIADLAEMGDKFTRNEILTSNEMRQIIGIKPADDPRADELRNSNMPDPNPVKEEEPPDPDLEIEGGRQNDS